MKFEQRIHEAFNARSLATEDVCKSHLLLRLIILGLRRPAIVYL